MQYNVAKLLKESVGSTRSYDLDDDVPGEDGFLQKCEGKVFLMRTDAGVWVHARFTLSKFGICSRCLKKCVNPVTITVDDEYIATVDVGTGKPIIAESDVEGSFTIDHRHVLNLDQALSEYTLLQGPMKLLCDSDCLGLCSGCGIDRNKQQCGCLRKEVNLKWTPLLRLLNNTNV